MHIDSINIRRRIGREGFDCEISVDGKYGAVKLRLDDERTQRVIEHVGDLIVAETCGIKTEQRESVINPGGPLVERMESGEHHLRRLAEELLRHRGETIVPASGVATHEARGRSMQSQPGETT